MTKLGERWRVFWIAIILSVWLVIIDGLNFVFNWEESTEADDWAKVLIIISGFMFCIPTVIGAFMLLIWVKPRVGALLVMIAAFVAGTLRLVATIIGFRDFWQEKYLDSTTAGTTDIAIAALQVYLIFDAFYLYRRTGDVIVDTKYQPVNPTDDDY